MNIIFSNKVSAEFLAKVISISNQLGIDPNWLMWVMYFESSLNHQNVNYQKGDDSNPAVRCKYRATGLIQFMPSTAAALGTSNLALYNMTAVQQLDYVYKYLKDYESDMYSMIDVYFAVFFPRAMNKPDDYVLQTSSLAASKIAVQNSGFDLNKDSQVTRSEVIAKVSVNVPAEYQAIMKKKTV